MKTYIACGIIERPAPIYSDERMVYLASDVAVELAAAVATAQQQQTRIVELEETIEAMSLAIGLALGHLDAGDSIAPGSAAHEAFKDLMAG